MSDINKIVYLIGLCSSELNYRKLPSNRQVMSLFFYKYLYLKKSIRESAFNVSKAGTWPHWDDSQ